MINKSCILPAPLPGFENIQRFMDTKRNIPMAKIQPGEFYVTTNSEAIVTVLGSCISACIRDTELGIGGMNHFMLPIKGSIYDKSFISSDAARYGNWAMEYLINNILKLGGRRRKLEAKVFGGGNVFPSLEPDICEQNIEFILEYLDNENLFLKAKDLGGTTGRIIVYYPKNGIAQVKYLNDIRQISREESDYLKSIEKKLDAVDDVELF